MSALQVIGDPVLHSLSPRIHGAMLSALGLDIPYTAHVVERGELPAYLCWAEENGITGFNATMPHKQDLIPLLAEVDGDAARFGAVNTVCRREGGWHGFNTDGAGCLAALEETGLWPAERVLLLGAGGAARAVGRKLAACGAAVTVCNRTLSRAEELCAGLPGMAAAPWTELDRLCAGADLLVNCTDLGMAGCPAFGSLDFLDRLPAGAGVFDLIYHPAETALLTRARELSHPCSNGLPMLVHQAIYALELFLDRPLDHAAMGAVVRKALEI